MYVNWTRHCASSVLELEDYQRKRKHNGAVTMHEHGSSCATFIDVTRALPRVANYLCTDEGKGIMT